MALTDGLVSVYQFASGHELEDSVGAGALVRYGTSVLSDPENYGVAVTFEAGKFGQGGVYAPGPAGGEGLVTDLSPLDTSAPFSIGVWCKPVLPGSGNYYFTLASANLTDSNNPFYVTLQIDPADDTNRYVEFGFTGDGTWPTATVYDPALAFDAYQFIVCGWDGANLCVSINGTAPVPVSYSGANIGMTGSTLSLGCGLLASAGVYADHVTNAASGVLNRVWLWNRALTSDEIATLYNSGAGLDYPFTAPAASGSPVTTNRLGISLGIGL